MQAGSFRHHSVEEAFNLATIRGACAAKMGKKTGSIAVGKAADLIVFSSTSPSTLAAAQHNPVAAIMLHFSPADVDTVMIDGVARKQNGKLLHLTLDEQTGKAIGRVTWS
jgi:cytosine/adenosine deaminase-related metal-dependent hydrolase